MKYTRHEAKEWARATLRDYMAVTTTPMLADLSIDYPGLKGNVEHILRIPRVAGVYVGSIYQEFWTLTFAERKKLAEVVVDTVGQRVPVIVGVSANCMADVLDLARHAQEIGADLVMIWPPTFGQRSPRGVLAFYEQVARGLDIGICVYASGLAETGFRITPEMLEALAEVENVCVVKEASFSLGTYLETLRRVGDRLAVSSPVEEYWLYGRLLYGDRYAVPVLMGSSRPLYLQSKRRPLLESFLNAVDAGDTRAAAEALNAILGVANRLHNKYLERGHHNVALTKAITEMFGMAAGPVRPPIEPASADEIEDARQTLANAGLVEARPERRMAHVAG